MGPQDDKDLEAALICGMMGQWEDEASFMQAGVDGRDLGEEAGFSS